jgi:hypothetical protein
MGKIQDPGSGINIPDPPHWKIAFLSSLLCLLVLNLVLIFIISLSLRKLISLTDVELRNLISAGALYEFISKFFMLNLCLYSFPSVCHSYGLSAGSAIILGSIPPPSHSQS